MKRVFVVLSSLVLCLAWVAPAQAAAPAWPKPTAPTAAAVVVGKTPSEATLTWSSPTSAGSKKVYGYSIVRDGGDKHLVFWQNAAASPKTTYAYSFVNLKPATTYTFALKAWSDAGSSVAANVSYTTPGAASSATLFAVSGSSLVSVPATGGTPKTVVSSGHFSDLSTDGKGSVFGADATAHTVVKLAAGSSTPTTVASGLAGPRSIAVDAAGTVYIADGPNLIKVTAAGTRSTLYTAAADLVNVTVTPSGIVSAPFGAFTNGTDETVVTVTAAGAVSTRELQCGMIGYCADLIAAPNNASLLHVYATGGSGYDGYDWLAPNGVDPTDIGDRLAYYAVGMDAAGTFYVAQSATWCTSPGEGSGTCRPDLSVPDIITVRNDGTKGPTLTVSGMTMLRGTTRLVVDVAGTIYANAAQGLVKVAPTGGAAAVVASGSYTDLVLAG